MAEMYTIINRKRKSEENMKKNEVKEVVNNVVLGHEFYFKDIDKGRQIKDGWNGYLNDPQGNKIWKNEVDEVVNIKVLGHEYYFKDRHNEW